MRSLTRKADLYKFNNSEQKHAVNMMILHPNNLKKKESEGMNRDVQTI